MAGRDEGVSRAENYNILRRECEGMNNPRAKILTPKELKQIKKENAGYWMGRISDNLDSVIMTLEKAWEDLKEKPAHRSKHNYQNGCTCGEIFEFVIDLEYHLKENSPCTK